MGRRRRRRRRAPAPPPPPKFTPPPGKGQPTDQDMICYAERYPDLKKAFGHNVGKLRNHWHQYGIREKRNPYCDTPTSGGGSGQSSQPQTAQVGSTTKTQSSGRVRMDPLNISKGAQRQAIAPTTVRLTGKALENAIDVFGGIDKEYGAFEKPPLNKCINLDADVTWGHKDLPAILIDWAEYIEQDEKDRIKYFKILEWVPAKEGDTISRAPKDNVLKPLDFWNKYIDTSRDREKDKASSRKSKRMRSRSQNQRPRRDSLRRTSSRGSLVRHKRHWHEVNKEKYPRSRNARGRGGKHRGPSIKNPSAWYAKNGMMRVKDKVRNVIRTRRRRRRRRLFSKRRSKWSWGRRRRR